jgi:DNA polymerase-4
MTPSLPDDQASRAILHVDMDAFFASVEVLADPSLRGKPVLVGYDGPRGVVAAASYEARAFGCHSAQPMAVAKRNCPHAIVVPVHFDRYRTVSRHVFSIFESFTPLVEPLSIDEAFLDVTASQPIFGDAVTIARSLKTRIKSETGVTASVGVAPNKFLAKLASDMDKPDGLTVMTRDNLDTILPPLLIGKIWGVGPKTAAKLHGLGVKTFADLRRLDPDVLDRRVGADEGEHFRRLAFGIDDRPVTPDREAKSIGQEQTFGVDVANPDEVRTVMLEQTEQVAARLRHHGLRARSVTVKIRFGDFQTVTRRTTMSEPTDATQPLWHAARELFDQWAREFKPVRLIGVTAGQLTSDHAQLELFGADAATTDRQRRLEAAVDAINQRFGKTTVRRAGS